MADNYLEKRMEQYRSHSGAVSGFKSKDGLVALLAKNRSTRIPCPLLLFSALETCSTRRL